MKLRRPNDLYLEVPQLHETLKFGLTKTRNNEFILSSTTSYGLLYRGLEAWFNENSSLTQHQYLEYIEAIKSSFKESSTFDEKKKNPFYKLEDSNFDIDIINDLAKTPERSFLTKSKISEKIGPYKMDSISPNKACQFDKSLNMDFNKLNKSKNWQLTPISFKKDLQNTIDQQNCSINTKTDKTMLEDLLFMNSIKKDGKRHLESGQQWTNENILIAEAFEINPSYEAQDNYYTLNKCANEEQKVVEANNEKKNNLGKQLLKNIIKNSVRKREISIKAASPSIKISHFKPESPREKDSLYSSPTQKTLKKDKFTKGFCLSDLEIGETVSKKEQNQIIQSTQVTGKKAQSSLPDLQQTLLDEKKIIDPNQISEHKKLLASRRKNYQQNCFEFHKSVEKIWQKDWIIKNKLTRIGSTENLKHSHCNVDFKIIKKNPTFDSRKNSQASNDQCLTFREKRKKTTSENMSPVVNYQMKFRKLEDQNIKNYDKQVNSEIAKIDEILKRTEQITPPISNNASPMVRSRYVSPERTTRDISKFSNSSMKTIKKETVREHSRHSSNGSIERSELYNINSHIRKTTKVEDVSDRIRRNREFNQMTDYLFTTDSAGNLSQWSISDQCLIRDFENQHFCQITSIVVSIKNKLQFTSDEKGNLIQYSQETNKMVKNWHRIHLASITCMLVTFDENYLVTCDNLGHIKQFSLEAQDLTKDYKNAHNYSIQCMASTKNSKYVFSGDKSGYLKQWNIYTKQLAMNWGKIHDESIDHLIFTNDNKFQFTLDITGKIMQWMFDTRQNSLVLFKHWGLVDRNGIYGVALNSTQNTLSTVNIIGELVEWDIKSRKCVKNFGAVHDNDMVHSIGHDFDTNYQFTSSEMGYLRQWNTKSKELVKDWGNLHNNIKLIKTVD